MNYWIIEMIKVFFAYMFILFIWPSVVFYKYFKDKSLTMRFIYCTIGVPIAVTTLVIMLGLFHLLNQRIFTVVFYLLFFVQFYRMLDFKKETYEHIRYFITGSMKFKTLLYNIEKWIKNRFGAWSRRWWNQVKDNLFEYLLLFIVSSYALIYFSIGCFEARSYGFGDMYVHHAWIYGLKQGQIFSSGIYPEGMHCLIYMMNAIFGIKIYNILLFLQPIQTSFIIIVSFHILIRELCHYKYTGIFALTLFLTLKVYTINTVYGMSRLQWSIPQDYGMYVAFLGAYLLLRYLKTEKFVKIRKVPKAFLINDELIWFSLSLALSIAIHFYVTGMMFFLCLVIVIINVTKVFTPKRFISLAASITLGFLIAILPMVGAYAEGIPLQGSIGWALDVMGDTSALPVENNSVKKINVKPQVFESGVIASIDKEKLVSLNESYEVINNFGYLEFYPPEHADLMRKMTLIIMGVSLVLHIILMIVGLLVKKRKIETDLFDGYFIISCSALVFMILYSAKYLGIIQLFAPTRLCTIEHLLNMAVLVIPFDVIALLYKAIFKKAPFALFGWLICGGLVYFVISNDMYHSYLYYEYTRHDSTVEITDKIISDYPKNSYTIVSVVDELYQVNEHGFHEEVLTFVNSAEKKNHYTLPSKYVFIYVEKKPIYYAQFLFFDGPKWLAGNDYYAYYDPENKIDAYSQYPHVNTGKISLQLAKEETPGENYGRHAYSGLYNRSVLQSKLFYWCRYFKQLYPYEMEVYYEDENLICYKLTQNVFRLYELSLDYLK